MSDRLTSTQCNKNMDALEKRILEEFRSMGYEKNVNGVDEFDSNDNTEVPEFDDYSTAFLYKFTTIKQLYEQKKISVRTYNALNLSHLETVAYIVDYIKSGKSLLSIPRLGKKSLYEINNILAKIEELEIDSSYTLEEKKEENTEVIIEDNTNVLIAVSYDSMMDNCKSDNVKAYITEKYPSHKKSTTKRNSYY